MRGLATVVVLAFGVALAAPIPKDKPKPDAEAIQGVWVLDKFEGEDKPPPDAGVITFTFKDGKLTLDVGGKGREKGGYKLDPTAKPKAIDLSEPGSDRTTLGIYELDGDNLKFCITEGDKAPRPKEFKAEGKRMMLFILKRQKDEKKDK